MATSDHMTLTGATTTARRRALGASACRGGLVAALALGVVACTSGGRVVASNGVGSGTAGLGPGGGGSGLAGTGTGGGGSGEVGGRAGGGGATATVSDSGRSEPDGSAGSDVGNAADAPNDPPADTASAACTGLLCEDFEQGQGQLDLGKWDLKMGASGTAMIQQQIVAHGKYAWHVHGTGAKGDFAMILTKNAPVAL